MLGRGLVQLMSNLFPAADGPGQRPNSGSLPKTSSLLPAAEEATASQTSRNRCNRRLIRHRRLHNHAQPSLECEITPAPAALATEPFPYLTRMQRTSPVICLRRSYPAFSKSCYVMVLYL